MADDIGNRHEQQIVVGGERRCVVERHHVARDAHEVGHDPDRTETGKTAQIDHCFGVAGSFQHAALSGPQREDVARTSEIIGGDLGAGQGSDGSSLIGRRGSGGVAIDEVDRNGECPTTGGFVLGDHELELELVCPIDRHRDADEAGHPTTQPHELLGVHELGGAGQSSRGGFESSSTTTMRDPAAIASSEAEMEAKSGMGLFTVRADETLDVLGEHVGFEVDGIANVALAHRRHGEGVRDDRDGEGGGGDRCDGEADAVDGDAPFSTT